MASDSSALNLNSTTPIYLQIAQDIRDKILNQELQAGAQIMSTTQYATTYRINPATANKAFTILQNEGLIYKQRGIGMFVTDNAEEILRKTGQQTYVNSTLAPAINEGLALGFTSTDILSLIHTLLEETK